MAAYKAPKPTKQQLSQAAARSKGQIPMGTTAKQLRGTTKIIATAATMLPAGRVVKVAAGAAKAAKAVGITKTGKAIVARKKENIVDRAEAYGYDWITHPGAASAKSNARLTKEGKWSSPKQIKRYQHQEAKSEIKAETRALKAAQGKVSKNNRGQTASPVKINILKNAAPARANRTRSGSMSTLKKQQGK